MFIHLKESKTQLRFQELRISEFHERFYKGERMPVGINRLERFHKLERVVIPFQGGRLVPWASSLKHLEQLELRTLQEEVLGHPIVYREEIAGGKFKDLKFEATTILAIWPAKLDLSKPEFHDVWSCFPNVSSRIFYLKV